MAIRIILSSKYLFLVTRKKFDFAQPQQWQKVASLNRKIQTSIRPHFEKQRNTSQHVKMGEEADSILYSFGLSDNDRKKYNTVSNKSEAHFVRQRNPIYEWRSIICVTGKGEPVDSFITSPYQLAEHYNYRDLHDEMSDPRSDCCGLTRFKSIREITN